MTENPLPLIARAQSGDSEAFAALFGQYKNLVFRVAYLSLGDTLEAEDALQEVFMLVHRYLSSYDARRGAFTTWLYRITMNYCANVHRRRKPLSVSLEPAGLVNEFPGLRLADEEAIWQAIHKLSGKMRSVIVLRYFSELPYSEIAQILEIPLGTVKSRLDLALKILRKSLDEQEANLCLEPKTEVSR
jgi:RNA polymerase sigma-70 factor (ECF subfamily)